MANFLLNVLSTLALGVIAVQGAAVSQNSAVALRVTDASGPIQVVSNPTQLEARSPNSPVGESVYFTSFIPLNDVMDEGSHYTITVSNSRRSCSSIA
jgi:hypothetical protein